MTTESPVVLSCLIWHCEKKLQKSHYMKRHLESRFHDEIFQIVPEIFGRSTWAETWWRIELVDHAVPSQHMLDVAEAFSAGWQDRENE